MPNLFKGIVGQEALLNEVDFYVDSFRGTGKFPHAIFVAERGAGKSSVAMEVGKVLKRPFHEVLAKDLTTDDFFAQIVVPLLDGKKATVFIDEASALAEEMAHTLLQICDTRKGDKTFYTWKKNKQTYVFDLKKITFLFATTNPQKVEPDLLDRLRKFTFDQYSPVDLGRILQQYTVDVQYEDGVLMELAHTLRNNPRNAFLRASDIAGYMSTKRRKVFTKDDLRTLKEKLHIMPLGLNKMEVQALRFVSERPSTSLTTLSAKMRMTADAIRRDIETRLLATNLIEIEARGRVLTPAGKETLAQIERILRVKKSTKKLK